MKRMTVEKWRESATPEERRWTAYHEAGHAVAGWMFGIQFEKIDMRGNALNNAYIRRIGNRPDLQVAKFKACGQMQMAKRVAIINALFNLAGPCVESITIESPADWLDDLFVNDDEGCCQDYLGDGQSDLSSTITVAAALIGNTGPRWQQFVTRMGKWTDELFAIHKVWNVVETLAEKLCTQDTITGDRARSIMFKAWGDNNDLPYMKLGAKWRRRFKAKTLSEKFTQNPLT